MADQQLPDILTQVHQLPVSIEKQEQLFNAFYSDTPRAAFESITDVPLEIKQAMFGIRGKIHRGEKYDLEDIVRSIPASTPKEAAPVETPKGSAIAEMTPEQARVESAKDRRAAAQRRAEAEIAGPPPSVSTKTKEEYDFFGRPKTSKEVLVPKVIDISKGRPKQTAPPPSVSEKEKEAPAGPESVVAKPAALQVPAPVASKSTAPPPIMPSIPPRKAQLEEVDAPGLLTDVARGLGRGAVSTVTRAMQGAANLLPSTEMAPGDAVGVVPLDSKPKEFIERTAADRKRLRKQEEEMLPKAPVSGVGQFSEALGSSVPFLLTGTGGAVTLGSLGAIDEAMRRLDDSGVQLDEKQRAGVILASGLLGATEALPLGRLFKSLRGAGAIQEGVSPKVLLESLFPSLKDIAKSGAKQFLAEGSQEWFAEIGQDVIQTLYGGRKLGDIGENAKEAFTTGGEVGVVLDLLTKLLGTRAGRARLRKSGVEPKEFKQFLEQDESKEFTDQQAAVDEFLKGKASAAESATEAELAPPAAAAPTPSSSVGQSLASGEPEVVEILSSDGTFAFEMPLPLVGKFNSFSPEIKQDLPELMKDAERMDVAALSALIEVVSKDLKRAQQDPSSFVGIGDSTMPDYQTFSDVTGGFVIPALEFVKQKKLSQAAATPTATTASSAAPATAPPPTPPPPVAITPSATTPPQVSAPAASPQPAPTSPQPASPTAQVTSQATPSPSAAPTPVAPATQTAPAASATPTTSTTPTPPVTPPATTPATQPGVAAPSAHPKLNDSGQPVIIDNPSTPTPDTTWSDASTTAVFTPGSSTPQSLGKTEIKPWNPPQSGWAGITGTKESLDRRNPFTETPGKKTGAGVIVVEDDGRIWLLSPTNAFGGYNATFPKGTVEPGLTMQENAIKEAWEETGLKVDIVGVLGDYERDTSKARYYIAVRSDGSPKDMGWEAQALSLATISDAKSLLNKQVDKKILDDLEAMISSGKLAEVKDGTPMKVSSYGPEKAPKTEGSNPGGWYGDTPGNKWLIKGNKQKVQGSVTPEQSDDRASNEVLAAELIRATVPAGAPKMKLVDLEGKYGGGLGVASKVAEGLTAFDKNNPDHLSAAQKTFALHAWLANYDVLGMGYDNTFIAQDGTAINIDPGGALLFRAQGLPKGASHGVTNGLLDPSAPEFESMQTTTSEQKAVFGKMTPEQLKESAQVIANITDAKIRKLVNTYGFGTDEKKAALADNLIQRRDAILAKVGLQPVSPTLQVAAAPAAALASTAPPPSVQAPQSTPSPTAPPPAQAAPPPASSSSGDSIISDPSLSLNAEVPTSVAQAFNSPPTPSGPVFDKQFFVDKVQMAIIDAYDSVVNQGKSYEDAIQGKIDEIKQELNTTWFTYQETNALEEGVIPVLESIKDDYVFGLVTISASVSKNHLKQHGESFGLNANWQSSIDAQAAAAQAQAQAQTSPSSTGGTTSISIPAYNVNSALVPDSVAQVINNPSFDKLLFVQKLRIAIREAYYSVISQGKSYEDAIQGQIDEIKHELSTISFTYDVANALEKGVIPVLKSIKDDYEVGLASASASVSKGHLLNAGKSFGLNADWQSSLDAQVAAVQAHAQAQATATPPSSAQTSPPPTGGTTSISLPAYNINSALVPDSVAQAINDQNFNKYAFVADIKTALDDIAYVAVGGYGGNVIQNIDFNINAIAAGQNPYEVEQGTLPYLKYLKQELQGKTTSEIKDFLEKAGQSFGYSAGWTNNYQWPGTPTQATPAPQVVAPPVTQTATPPSPAVATQPPPPVQQSQPSQPLTGAQALNAAAGILLSGGNLNMKDIQVFGGSFSVPEFVEQFYQLQTPENQDSFKKRLKEIKDGAHTVSSLLSASQSKLTGYQDKVNNGTASQFDIDRVKYLEDLLIPYLEYLKATGTQPVFISSWANASGGYSYPSGTSMSLPPGQVPPPATWAQSLIGASLVGKDKPLKDKVEALNFYAFANEVYGKTSAVTKKALRRFKALQKAQGAIDDATIEAAKNDAASKYSPVKDAYTKADQSWASKLFKYVKEPDAFGFAWNGPNASAKEQQLFNDFTNYQENAINTKLTGPEISVLDSYTGSLYSGLNGSLADHFISGASIDSTTLGKIKKMDSALSKIKLGYDMMLKRAVPSHYFWAQYGYAYGTHPDISDLKSWIGKAYTEVGVASTSVKPSWERCVTSDPHGKIVMKIKAGKENYGVKAYGTPISGVYSEHEVVLPRGTTFVIRSVSERIPPDTTYGKPIWDIEVDIVDQTPAKVQ